MTDATNKAKARPAGSLSAAFEEKIESPMIEVPAAFREFAETSVSQAKESYEQLKAAAGEATHVLEGTYAGASSGATEYGSKLIEVAHANTNAALDFAVELMSVKSFSEMIELSAKHTRKQLEELVDQTKELTALAQKVVTKSSEPITTGVSKMFNKVT
jgi:phasin